MSRFAACNHFAAESHLPHRCLPSVSLALPLRLRYLLSLSLSLFRFPRGAHRRSEVSASRGYHCRALYPSNCSINCESREASARTSRSPPRFHGSRVGSRERSRNAERRRFERTRTKANPVHPVRSDKLARSRERK